MTLKQNETEKQLLAPIEKTGEEKLEIYNNLEERLNYLLGSLGDDWCTNDGLAQIGKELAEIMGYTW